MTTFDVATVTAQLNAECIKDWQIQAAPIHRFDTGNMGKLRALRTLMHKWQGEGQSIEQIVDLANVTWELM